MTWPWDVFGAWTCWVDLPDVDQHHNLVGWWMVGEIKEETTFCWGRYSLNSSTESRGMAARFLDFRAGSKPSEWHRWSKIEHMTGSRLIKKLNIWLAQGSKIPGTFAKLKLQSQATQFLAWPQVAMQHVTWPWDVTSGSFPWTKILDYLSRKCAKNMTSQLPALVNWRLASLTTDVKTRNVWTGSYSSEASRSKKPATWAVVRAMGMTATSIWLRYQNENWKKLNKHNFDTFHSVPTMVQHWVSKLHQER